MATQPRLEQRDPILKVTIALQDDVALSPSPRGTHFLRAQIAHRFGQPKMFGRVVLLERVELFGARIEFVTELFNASFKLAAASSELLRVFVKRTGT